MTTPTNQIKQSLSGAWQFQQTGATAWLPATVPGGVHTDLLAAGRIPDPFVADNERGVQWVAQQDWTYRRVFTVDAALLAQERVFLVCDGLDTLAEVTLNGGHVGSADNMFQPYRWDVRDKLRQGENELVISFRSPVNYARARNDARPMLDVNNALPGAPYLRKAPSHFGWDWGPQIPAIGIWRDIRLEGYDTARLDDVHLRQHHTDATVTLTASAQAEVYTAAALRLTLHLTAPDGTTQQAAAAFDGASATVALNVDQPQLWWPNGYGEQPLYQVRVALSNGDALLDEWGYTVGLRTLELRQEPDEWGRSFTFVVNGVPIFAKGTNWIPADSFPTRVSAAQLEHLLGSAAVAHHNMVRIWGGGYYEDEAFYDLCDRYGLLVWQDFMFACAAYPLEDAALLANIKGEVVANVRRLRHRACLALWCGNNEIEGAWVGWGWDKPENADLKAAYERFFHHILPSWVEAEDHDSAYWPSSPSSNEAFVDPNGDRAGDVHQWAVWHATEPFSNYRQTLARFVSEFGFESLPVMSTVAAFAAPVDWNITSYIMEFHQRSPVGNRKIVTYMLDNFQLPTDFAGLVYLSQILQAEAMRYGVEHWRRHPACAGALYWQLNDCWPVVSWSSIDYFGRWKALQYASRRFYAPLLLSIEDDDLRMGVFVTNDRREPWVGQVRWSLESLDGERLEEGVVQASAAPLATVAVWQFYFAGHFSDENRRHIVLVCDLLQDGASVQTTVSTFVPTKHLALLDPQIATTVQQRDGQLVISLQAASLARFVALELTNADVIFSDNYFDLPAHRAITVTCPLPAGWTIEQARAALVVRSVFDTY